ncbi:Scarecrow-like protein 18, partial [Cucurbita argyrosperma subsp. argyrosperma]
MPMDPFQMRQLLIRCAHFISQSDFLSAHRFLSIISSNSSPYGDATQRLLHYFSSSLSHHLPCSSSSSSLQQDGLQSCYLSLNQITPFIRFCHLTANQAILEAIEDCGMVHVVDFDIIHGVQWPPLMQALAERFASPMLRITAIGLDLTSLLKTGDRLSKFAHSLGLRFHFHPLLLLNDHDVDQALNHYSLIFDSLEATMPQNSKERLEVEKVWFGREIDDVVSEEGNKRRQRHERYESWEIMLKSLGFSNIPLSPFALSQAKLLLRLHYPSEGYHLQTLHDSLSLGWQNRPLFSVSSWH